MDSKHMDKEKPLNRLIDIYDEVKTCEYKDMSD